MNAATIKTYASFSLLSSSVLSSSSWVSWSSGLMGLFLLQTILNLLRSLFERKGFFFQMVRPLIERNLFSRWCANADCLRVTLRFCCYRARVQNLARACAEKPDAGTATWKIREIVSLIFQQVVNSNFEFGLSILQKLRLADVWLEN